MSAMSDGTTRWRAPGDPAQPHVAHAVGPSEAAGEQPQHDDEPIPLPRVEQEPEALGHYPLRTTGCSEEDRAEDRAGTEPSPPTTTMVSARMLSTGAKMSLPSACWWSTSTPPANGAKPDSAKASRPDAGGAEAERLCVPFVLPCRDEVAHVARTLQPPHGDEHEQQREHGHEVEVALRMRAAFTDTDMTERRPLREPGHAIEEIVRQIVELDAEQALVTVQQERRSGHRERERGHRQEEPEYSERGSDDDRGDCRPPAKEAQNGSSCQCTLAARGGGADRDERDWPRLISLPSRRDDGEMAMIAQIATAAAGWCLSLLSEGGEEEQDEDAQPSQRPLHLGQAHQSRGWAGRSRCSPSSRWPGPRPELRSAGERRSRSRT